MAHPPESTRTRLFDAGLRITRQRLAVLDAVTAGEHLDVDTTAERVRAQLGTISTQAVCDVLRVLDSAALIRRIEPAGRPALFEIRVGDNHHHLVCRQCGSVADVDCAAGATPCLDGPLPAGFVADEAEVTWWGTCLRCQSKRQPHRHSITQSPSIPRTEEAAV